MSQKFFKLSLAVFILLAFYQLTFGQFQNLKCGIKGGLNLATTDQGVSEIEEAIVGADFEKNVYPTFGVGVVIEYSLSHNLSVVLNAMYNVKGTKFQGVQVENFIGLIDYNFTEKLQYLSFPLLAKYSFGSSLAKPYVFLGPEVSYLLEAKTMVNVAAMVGFDTTITNTVEDELESLEVGMNMGLGVEFPVSSLTAFFEASYGLGLTNVNNLEGAEDFKNLMIYLNVGILY